MEGYYTVFDKGADGDPAKAQVGFADINCNGSGGNSSKKSGGISDTVIGAVVAVALVVVASAMFFYFRSSSQQPPPQTDLGQPLVENQFLPPTNPTTVQDTYVANPGNPTTSMPHTSMGVQNDEL